MIIVAPWPNAEALAVYRNEEAERAIALVCEVVSAVRSTRARYGISPKVALPVVVKAEERDVELLNAQANLITSLANVESLECAVAAEKPEAAVAVLSAGLEVYLGLSGLVDFEAERTRLSKERDAVAKDAAKFEKKLSNPGFLSKAAPEIIEKDKAKLADLNDKLARLDAQISELD
jgi:valyl-tRNA synthetase